MISNPMFRVLEILDQTRIIDEQPVDPQIGIHPQGNNTLIQHVITVSPDFERYIKSCAHQISKDIEIHHLGPISICKRGPVYKIMGNFRNSQAHWVMALCVL